MSASRSTSSARTVPSRLAAIVMSWIWSRPWCAESSDSERVSVHFTGFASVTDAPRTTISSGPPPLPPGAAADVGGDDPQLVLGHAGGGGRHRLEDVRDLGRRPHGQLLAGG